MPQVKTLNQWLNYWENAHPKAIDFSLERPRRVQKRLWSAAPWQAPLVLIGGTNGKGTTLAALAALAHNQQIKVAAYTSPHLLDFKERLTIAGEKVSDDAWIAAFEAVQSQCREISLTYFEAVTLAAAWIVQQFSVDLVLFEVGMGGRLDATNLFDPELSIITRIALDHTAYLGETREQIAHEKAGIMRAKRPIFYGGNDLWPVMQQEAKEIGADLRVYELDFFASPEARAAAEQYHIPVANLACAQAAAQQLGLTPSFEALPHFKPLGRWMQREINGISVIFDVAHNPDGMTWIAQKLLSWQQGVVHCVIGMLADKDISGTLACLHKNPHLKFYVASPSAARAAPASTLAAALPAERVQIHPSIPAACEAAYTKANKVPKESILVTGSFYTVADAWGFLSEL